MNATLRDEDLLRVQHCPLCNCFRRLNNQWRVIEVGGEKVLICDRHFDLPDRIAKIEIRENRA